MIRHKGQLSRRNLIALFGPLAFSLMPIAKAMGYVAGGSFAGAPRFVMFFKGGSFHPPSIKPATIDELGGTPLAALAPHAKDLILFKSMKIHGGSPKTDGYQEEHAAGLLGCTTGNSYHYSKNDSYYAYTDNESIDVAIANHYQTIPALASLPFPSLHIGAGAHSDADNVGLGQRYISFRKRKTGDSQYGNAIEPIQNAGQVYDALMQRITLLCSGVSNQPGTDNSQLRAVLNRRKSMLDFRTQDIESAKRALGMDTEHAAKFDGLLDGWREIEKATSAELAALDSGGTPGTVGACPSSARPTGDGQNKNDLDQLSSVHDQMIDLITLAFQWDLTRVVAFTLSGASSGQRWPAQGVQKAHHTLEHSNDIPGQNTMGTYYAGKFARLLTQLKSVDDGGGQTALHNSSVVLGMECWSDSSSGHYLTDIPFMLAGQGGGAFQTGRIVDAAGRSNNDLLVSVQKASSIQSDVFGLPNLCKGAIV
ncbi:MAG TPA: DUF1552 domain-containing protein [Polyangiaceae bacterium]|nr:DUF1552 domain-containing protein [Polyangiaceae bacterium]